MSTRRQNPQNHTLLQVNMSPPRHISHSLLLPTTGLQVNTSSKPSEPYHHYRSPCHHLAIYLILYYHLLQVHRSTRRQNLRSLQLLQVTMSLPHHICYFLLLPTTCLQVNTSSKPSKAYQYYRSSCHHLTIYLNLYYYYYYLLQVYRSTCRQSPQNHTLLQVTMSPPELPYFLFSTTTNYMYKGQHVVKTQGTLLYYRSPCPHLELFLILC